MDRVIKKFMEKFIGHSDLPGWFPVRGEFLGATKTLKVTEPKSDVTSVVKSLLQETVGWAKLKRNP
jgi:hypothetical protein